MLRILTALVASLPIILGVGLAPAQAGVDYTYTILDYPGALWTECSAVNDAGQVVGYFWDGTVTHSFLWNSGVFTTTFDYPGASATEARGINSHGDIVGGVQIGNQGTTPYRGFLLRGGVFTLIDAGFPKEDYVDAVGINDAGDITGTFADDGGGHGYLLRGGATTVIDVPHVPPGDTQAYDVNNLGQVAAGAGSEYLATVTGGHVTFSPIDVPYPGGRIVGLNDVGQMVVQLYGLGYPNFGVLAEGILTLLVPPGYPGDSSAPVAGINNHGIIVGSAGGFQYSAPPHCFIATPHVLLKDILVHRVVNLVAHVGPADPVTRLGLTIRLGPESNGIDPLTEPVALGIGGVSLAIPPGSFRRGRDGAFHFRGRVGAVRLDVKISQAAAKVREPEYEVAVEARRLPRVARGAPVTINITIGDDMGRVVVRPGD